MRLVPLLLIGLLGMSHVWAGSEAINGYIGSDACKTCHQKIYQEWRKTLHSQMAQDVSKNPLAIIGDFESPSHIRTFTKEQVLYTIGNQWKQRYITRLNGELYILPAQYNLETGEWKPYHPEDWRQRPWLKNCGGCHLTGLDYKSKRFIEPGVGCEACHGPGADHVNASRDEDFAKTIVNPSRLAVGLQVQVCGSCHTRGKDPSGEHGYPANFKPGMSLVSVYEPVTPEDNGKRFWPNGHSKSHHQQYLDWQHSAHAAEGVTCISCHTTHTTGSSTRYQTRLPGNQLCLNCHTQNTSAMGVHSIHDFNNCIGCHMAKIVKSAESGDLHDHSFKVIPPADTLKFGGLNKQPNSCNRCHYHSEHAPEALQRVLDKLKKRY